MFTVEADFRQLQTLNSKLRGFGVQIPLKESANYQLASTRMNFQRQSTPDGVPWAPLKPSTIARKGHSIILEDTRVMMNSTDVYYTGDSAVIRNSAPYAGYHMTGTSKMPARVFMGFSQQDVRYHNQVFNNYIKRYLGG